jgi:hypothetical protein
VTVSKAATGYSQTLAAMAIKLVDLMTEDLKKAIEIIVPHENERQFYKSTVDKVSENPNELFESGKYRFGYPDSDRQNLTPDSKELPKYLFFDLLTEIYLPLKRKIKDKDLLWSNLSVFLINYDCNHLRRQLDFNIYENKDINFTVDNSSNVFADSDYLVYLLKIHQDEALGFLHRNKFDELKSLLTINDIEIRELR